MAKWHLSLDDSPRFIEIYTQDDALADIDTLLFANTGQEFLRIVDRYSQHPTDDARHHDLGALQRQGGVS